MEHTNISWYVVLASVNTKQLVTFNEMISAETFAILCIFHHEVSESVHMSGSSKKQATRTISIN